MVSQRTIPSCSSLFQSLYIFLHNLTNIPISFSEKHLSAPFSLFLNIVVCSRNRKRFPLICFYISRHFHCCNAVIQLKPVPVLRFLNRSFHHIHAAIYFLCLGTGKQKNLQVIFVRYSCLIRPSYGVQAVEQCRKILQGQLPVYQHFLQEGLFLRQKAPGHPIYFPQKPSIRSVHF